MRSLLGFLVLAASPFLFVACDKKMPTPGITVGNPDESPSAITIANVFGTCDDAGACAAGCDSGDSDQCRKLGTTYQFGNKGTKKDDTMALAFYQRACGMQNASGCVSAGQMFEFHHGVDEDDAKAASLYKQGCDYGYQVGCANYAIMLENGRGVPRDLAAAAKLYDGACQKGAGLACDRLRALKAQGPAPDGGATDGGH